jgi:hypothetical protein
LRYFYTPGDANGRAMNAGTYATLEAAPGGATRSVTANYVGLTLEDVSEGTYLGVATVRGRTRPIGGAALERTTTLDDFGRVEDDLWTHRGRAVEHVAYGYDRGGNRMFSDNYVLPHLSEVYHADHAPSNTSYSPYAQVKQFYRGRLDRSRKAVASPWAGSRTIYSRDGLGNLDDGAPSGGQTMQPDSFAYLMGANAREAERLASEKSPLQPLHTALDVVGIVDPTGIADIANAVFDLGEGDFKNAGISWPARCCPTPATR